MRGRVHGVLLLAGITACSSGGDEGGAPQGGSTAAPAAEDGVIADLRGDSNRDGEIRFDESDADKTTWDAKVGAVFLANIDDDSERCKKDGDDLVIARCNDSQDDIVNGPDDAADLARIKTKPWANAPEGTTARIEIETEAAKEFVRLFRRAGKGADELTALGVEDDFALTREEIENGLELAIESKDIVRDPKTWDGYVVLKLVVSSPKGDAEDRVKLRVAPVLTFHHLLAEESVWVSETRTGGNNEMRTGLDAACKAAGVPASTTIEDEDPWTQDFFETAYMSMPAPGGAQHAMRVNYRSANVFEPTNKKNPLRPAGQVVFKLRGKNVAGVQQFDPKHEQRMDSLNSFGNYETVPPFEHAGKKYPMGRVLRGKTSAFFPDKTFSALMDAQGQQPAIDIDTSWLLVGHVDETLSFVKSKSPRGWVMLANDARLAKKMLEAEVAAGHGSEPMFVGKSWVDWETNEEKPAQTTISQVLADTEVMKSSAEAAAEVDAQVAKIKAETGLTDAEIVRVPFLHIAYDGASIAYQPGMVNGIYVAADHFVAPDPHGPEIGGKDIFKAAMSEALAPHGVTVHFVEAWEYHVAAGEVHCGTNSTRKIPEAKWWESGR